MINWKSILSSFDDKPTLLQWLKKVQKALNESVLENVTITQNGELVSFNFNFADGTNISSSQITLPRGVSITGVDEISDEVVGKQTLTTLRVHYSNETSDDVVVYAENGAKGDKGDKGDKGEQGDKGETGETGEIGLESVSMLTTGEPSIGGTYSANLSFFNREPKVGDVFSQLFVDTTTNIVYNGRAIITAIISDNSIKFKVSSYSKTITLSATKFYKHNISISSTDKNNEFQTSLILPKATALEDIESLYSVLGDFFFSGVAIMVEGLYSYSGKLTDSQLLFYYGDGSYKTFTYDAMSLTDTVKEIV